MVGEKPKKASQTKKKAAHGRFFTKSEGIWSQERQKRTEQNSVLKIILLFAGCERDVA
jgi:hypothetical protein